MQNVRRINVRIDKEDWEILMLFCIRNRKDLAPVMREALKEYLRIRGYYNIIDNKNFYKQFYAY